MSFEVQSFCCSKSVLYASIGSLSCILGKTIAQSLLIQHGEAALVYVIWLALLSSSMSATVFRSRIGTDGQGAKTIRLSPALQQASIAKAQLAKINSRKPSLSAASNLVGRTNARQGIPLDSYIEAMHSGPRASDRPRLAFEMKNAGKLLQQLSTRLEAAGFSSRSGSQRSSIAINDDTKPPAA